VDADELRELTSRVNKAFYERVYRDPWLRLIFDGVPQEHIERQQTDFMVGAFGGPKTYSGRNPGDAHPHIYVTEEMWQLREKYLKEAFVETSFPEDLAAKWIKIDEAFKSRIVKSSPAECTRRFATDRILDMENPEKTSRKKAA
jgi:hemoglobin